MAHREESEEYYLLPDVEKILNAEVVIDSIF